MQIYDEAIASSVYSCRISLDTFRSSAKMKQMLRHILESSVVDSLSECWSSQSVKVRLDTMMKLLIEMLNLPSMSLLMGLGRHNSSDSGENLLLKRLKLLLIEGLTLFKSAEVAILQHGNYSIVIPLSVC